MAGLPSGSPALALVRIGFRKASAPSLPQNQSPSSGRAWPACGCVKPSRPHRAGLSGTRCKRRSDGWAPVGEPSSGFSPHWVQEGERAIATAESVTVIGAGLAGLRTVERLRHRGYEGRIVLLGAELHPPYDRPPLSQQVLRGERGDPWLRPADDYAGLDVEVRLGEQVLELDAEQRALRTSDARLPYDVLVIATGASPRRVPGLNGLVLRTLDHA